MKQFIECPHCNYIQIIQNDYTPFECVNCERWFLSDEIPNPLKALSIWQPWAWLIVNGYKDIENRSTLKNFRGKVLIHASMKFDKSAMHFIFYNQIESRLAIENDMPYRKNLDYGGIIGYAEITDCVTESDSPWFISGNNGFVLTNPVKLPFTPCKGKLGFFNPEIK